MNGASDKGDLEAPSHDGAVVKLGHYLNSKWPDSSHLFVTRSGFAGYYQQQ